LRKVLVIEDDQNKAKQIILFFQQMFSVEIVEKNSYRSGLREIMDGTYDLIILDMSIPIFDVLPNERNDSLEAYAGRDILRQMQRRMIDFPVIVVSQFETFGDSRNKKSLLAISEELKSNHSNYYGHVHYNAAIDNWKSDLLKLINNVWER
jgi:CheY-like chemotaxis protein